MSGAEILWRVVGAFISSMCFSVVMRVPKKFLPVCGLTGAVGWLVYLLSVRFGGGVFFANTLAALFVAFISQLLARMDKAPAIVFYIPGILPMVPGTSIYRAAYYLMQRDQSLASFYIIETLQIAVAIAIGIFAVDAVFRAVSRIKKSSKE